MQDGSLRRQTDSGAPSKAATTDPIKDDGMDARMPADHENAYFEDGTNGEDARTKGPNDNALIEVSIRQKEVVKITKK